MVSAYCLNGGPCALKLNGKQALGFGGMGLGLERESSMRMTTSFTACKSCDRVTYRNKRL